MAVGRSTLGLRCTSSAPPAADLAGTGRVAFRKPLTFPLETTYTVQKFGALFNTVPGISTVLNSLCKPTLKVQKIAL